MTRWIRFEQEGRAQFGTLEGETIRVHEGDMFSGARATDRTVALAAVKLLTPCVPTKMVALWNNYRALAEKLGQATPPEPLWFLKANSSFHPGGQPIRVTAAGPNFIAVSFTSYAPEPRLQSARSSTRPPPWKKSV